MPPWNINVTDAAGLIDDHRFKKTIGIANIVSPRTVGVAAIPVSGTVLASGSVNMDGPTASGVIPNSVANADYLRRSTAPSVLMATNFNTVTEVTDHVADWQGNTFGDADHVSWNTTQQASGNGCLQFDVLKADSTASGQWWRYLSDDQRDFRTGDTIYVQYRAYFPAYYATHQFLTSSDSGWKVSILSSHVQSNRLYEIVHQNTNHRGHVQMYHRNSAGNFPPMDNAISTPCNASDFVHQNAIDRLPGVTPSTCLEARQKYGGLYSYNGVAPDPETGAFIYYPDEWLTFLQKVTYGSFGASTADTHFELWAARASDTVYTKLIDKMIDLGTASEDGPTFYPDALWMLPYDSNRLADQTRSDTYTLRDEIIVSTAPIALPRSAADPAYFSAATEKTWIELTTQLADVDPCPASNCAWSAVAGQDGVTEDWTGAVATPTSLLMLANGGHAAYAGNEGYELDITAESPAWNRVLEPSTSVQQTVQYYSDGRPSARHTYDHAVFIPEGITNGNRWFAPHSYGTYGNPAGGGVIAASWQYGAADYDAQSTFPNFPSTVAFENASAWDSTTQRVWTRLGGNSSDGGMVWFDPITKTYSGKLGSFSRLIDNVTAAIDPERRLFAVLSGSTIGAIDLDNPTTSEIVISTTGTGPATSPSAQGFIFDPISSKFIAWNGGSTIYTLTPGADWKVDNWTWAAVTNDASNSVTPTAPDGNGTYGKFNYISSLHALVVVNSTTESTYVYKLPTGGL